MKLARNTYTSITYREKNEENAFFILSTKVSGAGFGAEISCSWVAETACGGGVIDGGGVGVEDAFAVTVG
jgi:hypothetical protein